MKNILLIISLIFFTGSSNLTAQSFSQNQIDQLTAPIALYPDLLVSLILPAATTPNDISEAAFYILGGGNAAYIDKATWAPSVKALAHYAQVAVWMHYNEPWCIQLGESFRFQEGSVLASIQRLRRKALNDGILRDSPEQRVIIIEGIIYIEPTDTELIYVPRYDPRVCLTQVNQDFTGPWIAFDRPYFMGPWLTYGCDWRNRHIVSHMKYDPRLNRSYDRNRFFGSRVDSYQSNKKEMIPNMYSEISRPEMQPGTPHGYNNERIEQRNRHHNSPDPNRIAPENTFSPKPASPSYGQKDYNPVPSRQPSEGISTKRIPPQSSYPTHSFNPNPTQPSYGHRGTNPVPSSQPLEGISTERIPPQSSYPTHSFNPNPAQPSYGQKDYNPVPSRQPSEGRSTERIPPQGSYPTHSFNPNPTPPSYGQRESNPEPYRQPVEGAYANPAQSSSQQYEPIEQSRQENAK